MLEVEMLSWRLKVQAERAHCF